MNRAFFKKYTMEVSMIVITFVLYLIGLCFTKNPLPLTKGALLGLIITLLKYKLMENTFRKAVLMKEAKARTYTQIHYVLRYMITGLVLVVAALEPSISLLGVFIGLISMKGAAYIQIIFDQKKELSPKK